MDDANRWKVVASRDPNYDGRFVYAVRSTGIYCRPSCPSRRPGRKQVLFFPFPEAAECAGFRPCRRCRPEIASHDARMERVRRAVRFISSRGEEPLGLAEVSAHVGASPSHLQREFKKAMGITPRQYADALRLQKLKGMLREGAPISASLYEAGYGSISRLYERAGAQLGMTPATYQRGGKGAEIFFSTAKCALGRVLVAATGRGVCHVSLGDSDEALEAELHREYPAAEIRRDNAALKDSLDALLRHLNGEVPRVDLPLDVRATAFQRRVWEHLRTIPAGGTTTYSEISQTLGIKNGARAVGAACAANPVALVVPCHRAVRADGGLGGYRWGIERKEMLLESERGRRKKKT